MRHTLLTTEVTWGPFNTKVGNVEVILTLSEDQWHSISFEGKVGLFGLSTNLMASRTLEEFSSRKKLSIKFSKDALPLLTLGPVTVEGNDCAKALMTLRCEKDELINIPLILDKKNNKFRLQLENEKKIIHKSQMIISGMAPGSLLVKKYSFS